MDINLLLSGYELDRGKITDVVLTHLHLDHAGGATTQFGRNVAPTFPNATYYIQEEQWALASRPSVRDRSSYMENNYIPLLDHKVLKLVEGPVENFFEDIDLIDIYSCFPCAVASTAEYLDLPVDGSRALTLTGGLPYFGGAGNNYSMHSLAEAVSQLRDSAGACALVTSVGGILSKHAAGIYAREPAAVDWAAAASGSSLRAG